MQISNIVLTYENTKWFMDRIFGFESHEPNCQKATADGVAVIHHEWWWNYNLEKKNPNFRHLRNLVVSGDEMDNMSAKCDCERTSLNNTNLYYTV